MTAIAHSSIASLILVLCCSGAAAETPGHSETPAKISEPAMLEWKQLDGNQINCTIAADGPFADSRKTYSSGLEWPSGTGKRMIYSAGLWVVGKHRPTGSLRTATMHFSPEYQPGPLLEVFDATTANDSIPVSRASDPLYRLYKVERATPEGDSSRGVESWAEWPGQLGAPYVDMNGSGDWTPGVDRPRFDGSQQVWCVLNDVNNAAHGAKGGTPPLGIEVRAMYWASNEPVDVVNTMFLRYVIINRSNAAYDSVYLGLWDDTDMGDANDDLSGCDTVLSMSYVYNGDSSDGLSSETYGSQPPAWGFALLQGPIVPASLSDSARFFRGWRPGYRNLAPSSFVVMSNNAIPELIEPPDRSPDYAEEAFCYLQGMAGKIRQYIKRPDSSEIRFFFSGDPIAGTGDLPDNFPLGPFLPHNHRNMLNMGPFTFAQSDTQEIVVALVISLGANRLESVAMLKADVASVRDAWNSGVVVGVENADDGVPARAQLYQNYPNPFNPVTRIAYTVPRPMAVRLNVFNVLGQTVETLVQGEQEAGRHVAEWDASGMSSGVYFYQLRAGGLVLTGKMSLLR